MTASGRLLRKLLNAKCSTNIGFCIDRQYGIVASSNIGPGNNISISSSNNGSFVHLQSPSWSRPLILHSTWLRDHCRCPDCYNELTCHKMVDISSVGLHIKPKHTELEANQLNITWPDGHKSTYKVDWLWQNVYSGYKDACRVKKDLWGGGLDSITIRDDVIQFEDYMNSDEALRTVLKSLAQRGFALVKNVPNTLEDTQRAAERICPLRLGFFGKIMEFKSHMLHRKSPILPHKIMPHTDQSYLTEPAGVKVIHCTDTDSKMLVNLVDGFNIAAELKKMDEEAYNTLSELPVLFEYTDDAFHHKCHDVILKHDALTGNLLQIKYNMYYRSALSTIPFEEMDRFYTALHSFSQLIQNSFQFCRIQPTVGTIILIDNWRILFSTLHSDNTKLTGCYLGWSDYMCRARRLGVVP